MKNGCIFLISARKNILKTCLTYLNKNYNHQFNYPILIFYHGNKYDDESFQESIRNINRETKYSFHKISASIPKHIPEKELFYNRTYNPYVRKQFPKSRIGYLHANFFWNNFMNYPELKEFDYLIRIDDDSWFKNPITTDLFEELDNNNKLLACAYTWNHVHHRVLETREYFFEFIRNYAKKYNVIPKCQKLKQILEKSPKLQQKDIIDNLRYEKGFHELKFLCGNANIYNRKMFETEEWKQYLNEFNKLGGGYKFRWGDCEVISLYYYLHIGDEFLDLKLKEKEFYHNQIDNKWDCIFDKECL